MHSEVTRSLTENYTQIFEAPIYHTLENKKEIISYILLFRNNLLYIIHQSISRLSYDYI